MPNQLPPRNYGYAWECSICGLEFADYESANLCEQVEHPFELLEEMRRRKRRESEEVIDVEMD